MLDLGIRSRGRGRGLRESEIVGGGDWVGERVRTREAGENNSSGDSG